MAMPSSRRLVEVQFCLSYDAVILGHHRGSIVSAVDGTRDIYKAQSLKGRAEETMM